MVAAFRSPAQRRRRALLAFALTAAAAAAPAGATLRYVATTGTDSGNCAASATPCRTIQYAVNQSAATGDEIRVAGGTYTGAGSACTGLGTAAVACVVNKEIWIKGGYSTGDWGSPDPGRNPTILDGESARRGLVVERTAPTAPAAALLLENFEVRNGRGAPRTLGTGDALTFGFGGGIDAVFAPVTIVSVTFTNNVAIGANSATDYAGAAAGGALALRSRCDQPRLQGYLADVRFTGNLADAGDNTGTTGRGGYSHGGALFVYCIDLYGTALRFEDNEARGGNAPSSDGTWDPPFPGDGSRGDGLGGAISIEFGSAVDLSDVVASGNLARGGDASPSLAGAVASGGYGGAIQIEGNPTWPVDVTITAADLVQNQALGANGRSGGIGRGGALQTTDAALTLDRVLVLDNDSTGGDGAASGSGACSVGEASRGAADGGGVTLTRYGGSATPALVTNSIVAANRARMGATGCEPGGGGGGFFLDGVATTFDHVTLAGNSNGPSAMQGSAVVLLASTWPATLAARYGIVADHAAPAGTAAIHAQATTSVTFTRGLFAGNDFDTNTGAGGAGTFSGLATTITAGSAQFLAPGSPGFDYRIASGSPAVDAAVGSGETLDFENQTRDAQPDLGADEAGSPPTIFADDFDTGDFRYWL